MGGREQRVVAGGEAHLEREQDRQPPALDQLEDPLDRAARMLARDRVLHLGEPDPAAGRVYPVGAILDHALGHRTDDQPIEPRHRGRHEAAGAADQPEHGVLDHVLLDPAPPL